MLDPIYHGCRNYVMFSHTCDDTLLASTSDTLLVYIYSCDLQPCSLNFIYLFFIFKYILTKGGRKNNGSAFSAGQCPSLACKADRKWAALLNAVVAFSYEITSPSSTLTGGIVCLKFFSLKNCNGVDIYKTKKGQSKKSLNNQNQSTLILCIVSMKQIKCSIYIYIYIVELQFTTYRFELIIYRLINFSSFLGSIFPFNSPLSIRSTYSAMNGPNLQLVKTH